MFSNSYYTIELIAGILDGRVTSRVQFLDTTLEWGIAQANLLLLFLSEVVPHMSIVVNDIAKKFWNWRKIPLILTKMLDNFEQQQSTFMVLFIYNVQNIQLFHLLKNNYGYCFFFHIFS